MISSTPSIAKPRIYIAGPMTGIKDFNKPAFIKAEAVLWKFGCVPINPATLHEHTDRPWEFYMRAAISALVTCDKIYLLRGFQYSRGAKIEHELAQALNMEVIYE